MRNRDTRPPSGSSRKPVNPFYVLLGVLGTALVVTGVAYGLMMYQSLQPTGGAAGNAEHPLYLLMRQYGNTLLLAELVLLAIFTFAAIKTDDYWVRRNEQIKPPENSVGAENSAAAANNTKGTEHEN